MAAYAGERSAEGSRVERRLAPKPVAGSKIELGLAQLVLNLLLPGPKKAVSGDLESVQLALERVAEISDARP